MEKMDQIELYFGKEIERNGKKMPPIGIIRDLDSNNEPYQYRIFCIDQDFKYKLKIKENGNLDKGHIITKDQQTILCGNVLYPEPIQPLLVISQQSQVCIFDENLKPRKITQQDIKQDEDGTYYVTPEKKESEYLGFISNNFDELPFLNIETVDELSIKVETFDNKKFNLTLQKQEDKTQLIANGIIEDKSLVSQIDNSKLEQIGDILCDLIVNCNVQKTFRKIGPYCKNVKYKSNYFENSNPEVNQEGPRRSR